MPKKKSKKPVDDSAYPELVGEKLTTNQIYRILGALVKSMGKYIEDYQMYDQEQTLRGAGKAYWYIREYMGAHQRLEESLDKKKLNLDGWHLGVISATNTIETLKPLVTPIAKHFSKEFMVFRQKKKLWLKSDSVIKTRFTTLEKRFQEDIEEHKRFTDQLDPGEEGRLGGRKNDKRLNAPKIPLKNYTRNADVEDIWGII